MFEITDEAIEERLESEESYHEGFSLHPSAVKMRVYSYEVRGVKLTAQQFMATGYLPVYGEKLSGWLKRNEITAPVSKALIREALKDSLVRIKKRTRNGKKTNSSKEYLFCGQAGTIEEKAYSMGLYSKRTYRKKEFKFVKNLLDELDVTTKDMLDAYLYRHTAFSMNWDEARADEKDASAVIGESIAYRLYETYPDKEDDRKLESFEDALSYADYLKETFMFSPEDCTESIRERKLSHELWDKMSYDEIEHYMTTYITDEDELERIDFSVIKELKEAEHA